MIPRHWSFDAPGRLLLLLAVAALLAGYLLLQRRRSSYETRFSDVELLASVMPSRPGWRRHLPAGLLLVAVTALTTGFARPSADVRVPREQATVVVALDVSGSMEATDVKPSRIAAAKDAAAAFVTGLPKGFAVGLVSFSSAAAVVSSPTQDHAAVAAAIDSLQIGGGTAIGDAVQASVQAAQSLRAQGSTAPVRVVLLSDGSNTVGQSVESGAQAAVDQRIPVSTIAYGTQQGVVTQQGQTIPVPVDTAALASLAQTTGGTAYTALSKGQLGAVYDDIAKDVGTTTQRRDLTGALTGVGLVLALGAGAASLLWFRVLP